MTWSEEEYQDYLAKRRGKSPDSGRGVPEKPKRRSKYNAQKTWVDGICFDSKKEALFYGGLKYLRLAGEIDGFLYHGKMVVAEGDVTDTPQGQAGNRASLYETDFVILYPDKTYEIVDTKGIETDVFKLKRKVLRDRYPKVEIRVE